MKTTDNRTATIVSWSRCKLSLTQSLEDIKAKYLSAHPFPHLVFENLFDREVLDGLLDELPSMSKDKWVHMELNELVKSNLRSAVDLGDAAFQFTSVLHSAGFLYLLSEMTGIKGLLPDPYLSGAAYHVYPKGGKFDVHADRNTDYATGLTRRIGLLIYLNKGWKSGDGGELELWNKEATQCEKSIEPIFNRTVLFEIGDLNFHGVRPVNSETGFIRKSFAVYFHTVGQGIEAHNSIYAPQLYQPKGSRLKRIAKNWLPPVLVRALTGRGAKY
jgi:hypothetical protein